MTPLTGTYEGRTYEISRSPTDDGPPKYRVHRNGGGWYWVRLSPQSCDCNWHEWKVDSGNGGKRIRDCIHIRALRHLLKGVKDGGSSVGS